MAGKASKVPVKKAAESKAPAAGRDWHPLESLRKEIDDLFDSFLPGRRGERLFDLAPWRGLEADFPWGGAQPRVDVAETDNAIEITAELPGLDEKDIEVALADDILTIKGEKKAEKEERKKGYYMSERRYGSFRRSFRLPESVDADKIAGNFDKGVLTLSLPKTAEAKKRQRKIDIKGK